MARAVATSEVAWCDTLRCFPCSIARLDQKVTAKNLSAQDGRPVHPTEAESASHAERLRAFHTARIVSLRVPAWRLVQGPQ